MISRRVFMSMTAAAVAGPKLAAAQAPARPAGKVALYANVGADLTHYDVDVDGMTLTPRETVKLPASVQYAWPHASRRYLYVASSNTVPGSSTVGTEHHVTAFAIDPATGALKRTASRSACRCGRSTSAPTSRRKIFSLPSTTRVRCGFTASTRISRPARRCRSPVRSTAASMRIRCA